MQIGPIHVTLLISKGRPQQPLDKASITKLFPKVETPLTFSSPVAAHVYQVQFLVRYCGFVVPAYPYRKKPLRIMTVTATSPDRRVTNGPPIAPDGEVVGVTEPPEDAGLGASVVVALEAVASPVLPASPPPIPSSGEQ